jgi:hypothetical protein
MTETLTGRASGHQIADRGQELKLRNKEQAGGHGPLAASGIRAAEH